jgi:hypothetical protein
LAYMYWKETGDISYGKALHKMRWLWILTIYA